MHEWHYYSPAGRHWPLIDAQESQGAYIEKNGITGLKGTVTESDTVVAGRAGVVSHREDDQFGKITGSLSVIIHPHDRKTTPEIEAEFRADWSRHHPGTLVAKRADNGLPDLSLPVRLGPGLISHPEKNPGPNEQIRLIVDVVGDRGLWPEPHTEPGPIVTVENYGEDKVYPRITWGPGPATITSPSGAIFPLPAVSGERTTYLDPFESGVVTDLDGEIDHDAWDLVAGLLFPEGVPPGQSRTWTLTNKASMSWDIGIADPWR